MHDTVPLNFREDDVTWIASKLSGAAEVLGEEVIELRNWLLRFRCASKELRVVIAMGGQLLPTLVRLLRTNGMLPGGT